MRDRKSKALHMIGNAHLDPVWLWTWEEGFQEAKATFRSALDRLNEYDDFLFTSSSAAFYEWIEESDPGMFEEIKQRVAEGRWEIVGGWWIQPDCNIPSGESFVRQGLYGQRYFMEKFGVAARVGYNVDSFGHAGSMPQILLKSGMAAYVFMRPHPHEQKLPSRLFWWESDDGSRVRTFRVPYEYCAAPGDLEQHVRRCAAEFRAPVDQLMCFYGVGNHGGGPTRVNIESIRRLQSDQELPELLFSTPSRYFDAVANEDIELPVVHDELQHHAAGCYSAHSGIKRWNRQAENALIRAEKMCSLAMALAGAPYPGDFKRAWKNVLFNQFHDILAGTSVEPAYEDAENLYGEAMSIASRNLNNAVQAISWRIQVEQEEGVRPIVVFNPHSWQVCADIELELGRLPEHPLLLDEDGARTPFQLVRSYASANGRHRMAFLADVPAMGYATYRLSPGAQDGVFEPKFEAAVDFVENEFYRLEVNPDTGNLRSLFDKRLNFEWLRREAKAVVMTDPSDTWSHGVLHFDRIAGEFKGSSSRLMEHGPVKSVLRTETAYERSTLTQDFTLYPSIERIDVRVTVAWHQHFEMLKLSFPLNLDFTSGTYEIPYGVIQRPANGEEEPGQSWVDITGIGRNDGRRMGLSLLNDGKYSYDMKDYVINLTVLRSPIYAHHVPYDPQPDRHYTFIDQGVQKFIYSLLPHLGSWEEAGTVKRAAELNQPLVAQVESSHDGPLPQRTGLLEVESDSVVVTAMKRAEDCQALVIRAFEGANRESSARISIPAFNRTIAATFRPSEVKSFLVPLDPSREVRETNLLECEAPSQQSQQLPSTQPASARAG